MKAKFLAIAAIAAVISMTACSKEDGAGKVDVNALKNVMVTVQGEALEGRAVGDKKASGTVALTNGQIVFTNGSDAVTHVIDIIAGTTDYSKDDATVGQEKLKTGAAFTELNPTTQKVYLIGNYSGTIAENVDLKTLNITQVSQYKADGSIDNVAIVGGDALQLVSENNYSATFTAKPVIGRMEIEKITPGGDIESCKITGIFINRYYDQMSLYGAVETSNLINNSYTAAWYAKAGGGSYVAANEFAIYDYDTAGLDKTLASGKAYAYNCLALPGDDGAMVSIVIRISDIKLTGGKQFEDGTDRFLSIQNFYKNPGASQTKITSLERGNIYTIPNVSFTQTDITTQPEMKSINATVIATVMDWKAQIIGYDFD
ncbi:hypothetical protein [uncultured Alistipes sp.]|jgi:lipoprotein|uniref:hypothetical protein n=1 Tax=uncultured Alistipes sp. TaxID=538949 RepID=UPI0026007B12|nr:hypothetical protein [uncultured Alistipes sp.]